MNSLPRIDHLIDLAIEEDAGLGDVTSRAIFSAKDRSRGFIDAIIYPEDTREVLAMALRTSLHNRGPHLGPFVLPPHLGEAK